MTLRYLELWAGEWHEFLAFCVTVCVTIPMTEVMFLPPFVKCWRPDAERCGDKCLLAVFPVSLGPMSSDSLWSVPAVAQSVQLRSHITRAAGNPETVLAGTWMWLGRTDFTTDDGWLRAGRNSCLVCVSGSHRVCLSHVTGFFAVHASLCTEHWPCTYPAMNQVLGVHYV